MKKLINNLLTVFTIIIVLLLGCISNLELKGIPYVLLGIAIVALNICILNKRGFSWFEEENK